jgi:hypothetical protein
MNPERSLHTLHSRDFRAGDPRDPSSSLDSCASLQSLPDDELLRSLEALVARSRRIEADLVAHIGEVDQRRLYARFAFSSMFDYCTRALHLSEAGAYRRITVARAARQHPMLLPMLRDGRLHLSAMAALVSRLTAENRDTVLARATHASKRQVDELLAELEPRPDAPSRIRRLPETRNPAGTDGVRRADTGTGGATGVGTGQPANTDSHNPSARSSPGCPVVAGVEGVRSAAAVRGEIELSPGRVDLSSSTAVPLAPEGPASEFLAPSVERPRTAAVETLSPGRYKVQFTASAALRDKLERLAAHMRAAGHDGDLAAVIDAAVGEKLERIEARRFARTAAPRKALASTEATPSTRHIPAPVRRAVHERDEGRCRFVDGQGRRCAERHGLEFHHRHPFGMGGDHSLGNVSLLCRQHNRSLAEHDYGHAAIGRHGADVRDGRESSIGCWSGEATGTQQVEAPGKHQGKHQAKQPGKEQVGAAAPNRGCLPGGLLSRPPHPPLSLSSPAPGTCA